MEDDEGYMVLERRSKRGTAGNPPASRGAARGCPRWHRVALGAGWTGNLLLGAAVVALGCSLLHLQPEGPGSGKTARVGGGNTTVECFVSQLREALCLSQPPAAQGCRICPAGWTLGSTKCYWVSTGYSPWSQSRKDCEGRGATLLLPRDQDELEFLNETLQKSGRSFWIGLWEPAGGTGWTWVNGSRLERHRCPLDIDDGPGKCGTMRNCRIIPQECGLELQWICQSEATKL